MIWIEVCIVFVSFGRFWFHGFIRSVIAFLVLCLSLHFHSFFVPDEGLCLSSKICLNKYTLYDKVKVFSICIKSVSVSFRCKTVCWGTDLSIHEEIVPIYPCGVSGVPTGFEVTPPTCQPRYTAIGNCPEPRHPISKGEPSIFLEENTAMQQPYVHPSTHHALLFISIWCNWMFWTLFRRVFVRETVSVML